MFFKNIIFLLVGLPATIFRLNSGTEKLKLKTFVKSKMTFR
ncbi:hypothetical protein [Methanosarcina siciliae]|nr:hypothetical protein [Methanosarcina siciliae]